MKNPRTSSLLITLLSTLSYLPDRVLVLGKAVRARAPTAAPTYVGGSTVAVYPPPSVTVDTSVFPDESHLGFTGPTPTGDEPFIVETAPAYPYNNDIVPLIEPGTFGKQAPVSKPDTNPVAGFNPLRYWGNLSPWYSTSFGLDKVTPLVPEKCVLTQVHFLYRHGARYPTTGAPPAQFAAKVHSAAANGSFFATGPLEFLNSWTFKLGAEILTPFGRKQMFNLGVAHRQMYGNLLKNFTESGTLPVFRSESQDRMVKSALNWAAGFFGIPYEDQFELELIIETPGLNNTFAPYDTCVNANNPVGNHGSVFAANWTGVYLQKALARLKPLVHGLDLTLVDVNAMLNLCAYESVALGWSPFCPLFTEEEFQGFEYGFDIAFWYNNAFGSPVGAAQGAAYANELLARLKNVPLTTDPFSANQTLDGNNETFPLGQSIYSDATHDVVVLNILTALNFTSLATSGPPPLDHIPKTRSFEASQIVPFGTNLVAQVIDCPDLGPSIRFFLNDGALPIGIEGCPQNQTDALCPLPTFIKGLEKRLESIDWTHDCLGNYTFNPNIRDGRAPRS